MEMAMAHGLVTMVDWALGLGGLLLSLDDDDDDNDDHGDDHDDMMMMMMMMIMMIMTMMMMAVYPFCSYPPPTHSYVRPCLHTSSAACYTGLRPRGGGGGHGGG